MAEEDLGITHIDPDGDIILEFSSSDGGSQILVSSKVLSMASPVFKAMFNSRFREGLSNLPASGKLSIPLPDDNAEAFAIFCKAIHHRTAEIPRNLPIDCLENLAIIGDKYDCTSALSPWSNIWLLSWVDSGSIKSGDLNKLLFVAFVLDCPKAFSRISWEILLLHVGPFLDLPGITDSSLVTRSLLCRSKKPGGFPSSLCLAEFEARRADINFELQNAVDSLIDGICSQHGCPSAVTLCGRYLRKLHHCGLWPFAKALHKSSLEAIFGRMLSFCEPDYPSCAKNCYSCPSPKSLNMKEKLRNEKDRISNQKIGICLDCVKTERDSLRKKECRIKHP